ncbi:sh3 domain-binding glutamic acid-rich-like protein [Anaeramoeba flamelloides]|uniref:Sh3 domain-binding glutamic acid-rich-like protein n=1 Tax=Anaeramoeba flamelloides TaxID=1746091 RepID=A0ABQ8ZBR6_9EUKA|nr:sh3 domain-binding glutamic acid-rich-like protein [Anaeramoeba flamelloides]
MEAEAARIFCNKHKDNINLVGVIKDGDTKLATIFETTWKQDKFYWMEVLDEIIEKRDFFLMKKNNLHNINIGSVQDYEIEKQNLYKLSPQLIQLNEIITELSEQSKEFFEAGSTNKCESFMNSRTKFVEKRFNITKQWEMRCQFSALNRELPEWKTILMEKFGLTINLPQIISQYKKNLEKEYEKEDKIPKNTKEGRFRRRLKNIQIRMCYFLPNKIIALLHEIIFHKRILLPHEQDIIAQNVLLTKKKLYQIKYYLNSSLIKLKEKVSKSKKVQDVMNLNKKNEAFINLSVYINEFEKTFKIKKKPRRTKTLILNQDEYNGDIEIFKEIQENEEINEFVEEKIKEKSVLNDKDLGNKGIFNKKKKRLLW